MARIVVIGGGLAGLTAALRLAGEHQVHVLEAGARLGGQIYTVCEHGFVIERGAEGFVARSQAVPKLALAAGLDEGELMGQSISQSYGFDGRELRALAPGEAAKLLGFQVPQEELGQGIRSFRRGMGSLIAALGERVRQRAQVELGTQVRELERRGAGITLRLDQARTLEADAVVMATSAAPAAAMLAKVASEPAAALAAAPTLSAITVELGFERAQIAHPLDGTGFVVALAAQREGLRACTFTSSKFAARAPADKVSLRVFLRPSADELATLDAEAWRERALRGLGRVLAVRGAPIHTCVSIWANALPVFDDARRARVANLEAALAGHPIVLAGSAFHGAGIDAAVRSGERAHDALNAALSAASSGLRTV